MARARNEGAKGKNLQVCGDPHRAWTNGTEREDAKRCDECRELSKKERECLRCGKKFIPGCAVKFTCYNCWGNRGNWHG